jgi:hypothetical protein
MKNHIHSLNYFDVIDEIVIRTKKMFYKDLDKEDRRNIAKAYLAHPDRFTRRDAQDELGACASDCVYDWVGHLVLGEFDKVTESILDHFCGWIDYRDMVGDDLLMAFDKIYPDAEDRDPFCVARKGGKIDDVL